MARILILEDDPLLGKCYRDELAGFGYEVAGPFRSVEDAAAELSRTPFDAAMLDYELGDDDDCCELARALDDRDIPFVIVSGFDKAAIRQKLPKAQIKSKPFGDRDMFETLQTLTAQTVSNAGARVIGPRGQPLP